MQMRADMAAAYLDYRNTAEFGAGVLRGDAPAPAALRGAGRRREPIWDRRDLDRAVAPRATQSEAEDNSEDLQTLL